MSFKTDNTQNSQNSQYELARCVFQYILDENTDDTNILLDKFDKLEKLESLKRILNLTKNGTRARKILMCRGENNLNILNSSGNMRDVIAQNLLKNQLDYLAVDFKTLQKSKILDGKIKIGGKNNKNNKNNFEVLIISPGDIPENHEFPEFIQFIQAAGENNIKIMTVMNYEFSSQIKNLMTAKNFKICKNENDLVMNVIASINPDVLLKKEAGVVYMKKVNTDGLIYLFVNLQESSVDTGVELYIDKKSKNKEYKFGLYNPVTDDKIPLNVEIKNNKAVFNMHLPVYGIIIVTAEFQKN